MESKIRTQKDNLARLMAGENLTVVHRKTPTAYFDLKNRLLCCPIFKEDISPELYDLFMGHEVGHALWTPYEGVHSAVTKNKTLKGYLNVVEDVRIERNIRNKYAGLRKSFFTAYNELMGMDFFGVKDRDLNTLSLIDKINLITKCGSRINIKLSKEEQFFLDWSLKCETWEDVEECATAIYEWSKENETRTEDDEKLVPQMFDIGDDEEDEDGDEDENMPSESWDDESEESDEEMEDNLPEAPNTGDGNEESESDEEEETEEEGEDSKKTTGGAGSSSDAKPEHYDDEDGARESITEHNAHNNEEKFVSETNIVKTQIDLKVHDFNKYCEETLYDYKLVLNDWRDYYTNKDSYAMKYYPEKIAKTQKMALHTFKKIENKNKAIINHMAKEFEMRQTALASKHAFSGKTGKLDMNRLAKYQIVEDVFKRVTYLPDGKNHGVNIMLDWSGSICREVQDLLEQALILTMFCRKVNIPHRVYLFSDNITKKAPTDEDRGYWRNREGFLIELFSNEMSAKEYKEMMVYASTLWNHYFIDEIRYGGGRHFHKKLEKHNEWFEGIDYYDPSQGGWIDVDQVLFPDTKYSLGGTPLDATLVAMRGLLPKFNKAYGIEKSILTVITDGYSHSANILDMTDEEREEQKSQIGDDYDYRAKKERDIIDPINGRVYDYSSTNGYGRESFAQTQNLLDWLTQTTGVTVTGYFVCGKKGDMTQLLQAVKHETCENYDYEKQGQMWREARNNGLVIQTHGYNKLFLTAASALATEGEDSLDDELIGAKKSTLTARFKKNQRSKSTSRFLTNEFIKEIA